MLRFDWIAPDQLGQVWATVRPGLETVRAHSGCEWLPEDVYMELKSGSSHLHLCIREDRYSGFVVTTPVQAHDGKVLHIWCAYSDTDTSPVVDGMHIIDEWARNMQAKRITFHSPRRGWEKVGEKIGFSPVTTIYQKEV